MPRQKTTQAPKDTANPPSYISFPPFRATPLPLPTTSPPNLTISTSSNPPSSKSSAGTPPDTPVPRLQRIVEDPLYYDRFAACVYFGKCGGWVAVSGTACRACVKGKAGGVLDKLREAAHGDR